MIETGYAKADNTATKTPKTKRRTRSYNSKFNDVTLIDVKMATEIEKWLDTYLIYIDSEGSEKNLYDELKDLLNTPAQINEILKGCKDHMPVFVLFDNYYRVKPSIP